MSAVPTDPEPVLGERLRSRLSGLAAEALGRLSIDQVPAPLRRLASFAPARRARLGGDRILELAGSDPELRSRLGVQARVLVAAAATELDQAPEAGWDGLSLDAAALAWLTRPPDWTRAVAAVAAADRARAEHRAERAAQERARRLQRQLAESAEELKEQRRRSREELDALRRDNAELRRKLGETRRALSHSEQEAAEGRRVSQQASESARSALNGAEAEVRRLRARVAELEQRISGAQRERRLERDEATLRARLLLDSVVEAATGLKRELGLPAAEGAPADLVPAERAEPGHRTPSGAGSLPVDDPALLDALLALPRAHLVVDGYNVTKTAWSGAPLDVQRDRLLGGLAALAARTGVEVTAVFDAAEASQRPLVAPPRGVRVRFTPPGVIADDLIRRFVAAEPEGRVVVVATSDQEVVRDVLRRRGVHAVAALALVRLIGRS